MSKEFSISTEWISANFGPSEVRDTSGLLSIQFGDYVATRAEDSWSKSVQTSVRLSAYPLALWFAESWWRLLWEPGYESAHFTSRWRLNHDVSAAGHGFIWPHLIFQSDGETMEAACYQGGPTVTEPVRYLETFQATTPSKVFEQRVDEFIALVLARLEAVGVRGSELQHLWKEVCDERNNHEASQYRRFEAMLGFETDEAPEELVDQITGLMSEIGTDATSEIAPACAGDSPELTLKSIVEAAKSKGVPGQIEQIAAVNPVNSIVESSGRSWERGWTLARSARKAWGLGKSKLSDNQFAEILGIPASTFRRANGDTADLPLSLAVRGDALGEFKLVFRRHAHTGRRFEAARFVADNIIAPQEDRWLPSTDAKTVRQKIQRSFAAEFLCPIESLVSYLDGNYSMESIEEAGDHFEVSPLAVRSHLANNKFIDSLEVSV